MLKKLLSGLLAVMLLVAVVSPAMAQDEAADTDTYVVRAGDTLSAIARAFDVTLVALARANGIANLDLIFAGETLSITEDVLPTMYTVRFGDTLAQIAFRYGTTVRDIMQANDNIVNPNLIYPGQELTLPAPGEGSGS